MCAEIGNEGEKSLGHEECGYMGKQGQRQTKRTGKEGGKGGEGEGAAGPLNPSPISLTFTVKERICDPLRGVQQP